MKDPSDIIINALMDGEEYKLNAPVHAYRSLMFLIKDKIYPDGFGECGGMGRCGTCKIEILSRDISLISYDRNEEATLKKLGVTNPNVRLSCQIFVTEQLNDSKIKIMGY